MMIQEKLLRDLLLEKVVFLSSDSRGFHNLKCPICSDYKIRAGFKFDNDEVGYNCWNCNHKARYVERSGRMSKNMRILLESLDITKNEIQEILNNSFFIKRPEVHTLETIEKISTETPTISLPVGSIKLGSMENVEYENKLIQYLKERKIDHNSYTFYYNNLNERLIDRILIPFYKNNKLIYWQGRSINKDEKKRYENAYTAKDAVIFNHDKLFSYDNTPLFVCEGVFDALMVDGIAIIGSSLSKVKQSIISATKRDLIFIIDKDENGKSLAKTVLELGYKISFVPDGANDINDSVIKYGKIFTIYNILKNTTSDKFKANLMVNMFCV